MRYMPENGLLVLPSRSLGCLGGFFNLPTLLGKQKESAGRRIPLWTETHAHKKKNLSGFVEGAGTHMACEDPKEQTLNLKGHPTWTLLRRT